MARRGFGWPALLALLVLAAAGPAPAQELKAVLRQAPLTAGRWLPAGARLGAALSTRPREVLIGVAAGGRAPYLVRLGRLAFRSPLVLGGRAGRLGLSCATCHPAGATNARFFVPGNSDRPGNADLSHGLFNRKAEDNRADAVNIPALRGLRFTAPYGRDGRIGTIRAFTRNVIAVEFGGDEPPALVLDALVAYQREFGFLPNPVLGSGGVLTAAASPEARAGERQFVADCAGCHLPRAGFVDGRAYDVGTGGYFETPTLLGLAESAPYLHDGRAADLAQVVRHFSAALGLGYGTAEVDHMVAYLDAVGAAPGARVPVTLSADLNDIADFADLILAPLNDEDAGLADRIVDLTRFQLGRVHERFPGPDHGAARDILAGWSRDLSRVAALARDRRFPAARDLLRAVIDGLTHGRGSLEAVLETSLYNPERLAEAQ